MTCSKLAVMHQERIINIYSIYSAWFVFGFILQYAYNALHKLMLTC